MNRRVRLADVARAAGVAPSTASLVLSGRGTELRISEAVQQRVRAVSAELGYRPNIVSLGLSKGATRTLGFVSDTVATSQLAGDMIKGAIDAARERGYLLFIGETEGDGQAEKDLLEAMADRQVDGLVLASMFTRERGVPAELERVPAVLLNTVADRPTAIPAVVPDEVGAGRVAARVLLDAGHREVHLVGAGPGPGDVPLGSVAGEERLLGIREALAEAGVEPASGRARLAWHPQDGREATRDLLAVRPRPGALICFNDRLALGAYQALQEAGLRIPEDVSVISFDDHPLAGWLQPGLTSLAIPHEALGRTAIELLVDALAGADAAPRPAAATGVVHRIPTPLRSRGSVGPPGATG
ncbi:LacI family DNA-binding transcriptional regulator [Actinotalea sp. AC32]|nr:LacI family DNA-binding transcriptional regulator [Actinotalea sp. AC32]